LTNLMRLRGMRNGRFRKFCPPGKLKGRFCTESGGNNTHLRRIIQRNHKKV
jgi:hypothetical protein